VVSTFGALKPEEYEAVNKLLAEQKLPAEITDTFLQAINSALKGLRRKIVKPSEFAKQIMGDGTPLKQDELRARFETWLKAQMGDDDPTTVRFMLEG
jgi:hypothetical protein